MLDSVLVLFLDELGLPKEPVGLLRGLIFLGLPLRAFSFVMRLSLDTFVVALSAFIFVMPPPSPGRD